ADVAGAGAQRDLAGEVESADVAGGRAGRHRVVARDAQLEVDRAAERVDVAPEAAAAAVERDAAAVAAQLDLGPLQRPGRAGVDAHVVAVFADDRHVPVGGGDLERAGDGVGAAGRVGRAHRQRHDRQPAPGGDE